MPRGPTKSKIIAQDTPPSQEGMSDSPDERQQSFPGIAPPPPPPPEFVTSPPKKERRGVTPLEESDSPSIPVAPKDLSNVMVGEEDAPDSEDTSEGEEHEEETPLETSTEDNTPASEQTTPTTSNKKKTPKKRNLGEVMVLEKMTLPHPANKEGEKETIEVFRLVKESMNNGQTPLDVERWLAQQAELSNGAVDSGEFMIIRRIKNVKIETQIIRKITMEEIGE